MNKYTLSWHSRIKNGFFGVLLACAGCITFVLLQELYLQITIPEHKLHLSFAVVELLYLILFTSPASFLISILLTNHLEKATIKKKISIRKSLYLGALYGLFACFVSTIFGLLLIPRIYIDMKTEIFTLYLLFAFTISIIAGSSGGYLFSRSMISS